MTSYCTFSLPIPDWLYTRFFSTCFLVICIFAVDKISDHALGPLEEPNFKIYSDSS